MICIISPYIHRVLRKSPVSILYTRDDGRRTSTVEPYELSKSKHRRDLPPGSPARSFTSSKRVYSLSRDTRRIKTLCACVVRRAGRRHSTSARTRGTVRRPASAQTRGSWMKRRSRSPRPTWFCRGTCAQVVCFSSSLQISLSNPSRPAENGPRSDANTLIPPQAKTQPLARALRGSSSCFRGDFPGIFRKPSPQRPGLLETRHVVSHAPLREMELWCEYSPSSYVGSEECSLRSRWSRAPRESYSRLRTLDADVDADVTFQVPETPGEGYATQKKKSDTQIGTLASCPKISKMRPPMDGF